MQLSDDDRPLVDIQAEIHRDTQAWFPELQADLGYLSLALCGEAGEFANIIKKVMRGSLDVNDKITRVEMAYELADVLIYLGMIANLLDIDLGRAYNYKRGINVGRFGTETDSNTEDGGAGSGVVSEV
jgi:NTP pyrophosphatase (non-canonical NTP hydrolase)